MGGPLIRTKTGVILLAVLVLGGSFLSTLYGAVHAKKIKTSFHDITINKQVDDLKEMKVVLIADLHLGYSCLLYTSPSPRDGLLSRMPSSA